MYIPKLYKYSGTSDNGHSNKLHRMDMSKWFSYTTNVPLTSNIYMAPLYFKKKDKQFAPKQLWAVQNNLQEKTKIKTVGNIIDKFRPFNFVTQAAPRLESWLVFYLVNSPAWVGSKCICIEVLIWRPANHTPQ